MVAYPATIPNWVNGEETLSISAESFNNLNPHTGEIICKVTSSNRADVHRAIEIAKAAQPAWAATPPVQRGLILHNIVRKMLDRQDEIAKIVAEETGKTYAASFGETSGAVQCGLFYASEGQRLYGKTTTSSAVNKYAMTVRQPMGVAGLIVASNTPIANVAWKAFPALVCGNSVVLKAAEDAPATAWIFGQIAKEAGLSDGVFNILQGYGPNAGQPIVEHENVDVISFTGSSRVGKLINEIAAKRLAKISLELGGKNALIVCDDADIDNAVKWTVLSAFSNAGQRCASGSRVIIFKSVYDEFVRKLEAKTSEISMGVHDGAELGPVINERQLNNMVNTIQVAVNQGATVVTGGSRYTAGEYAKGFYMQPTLITDVDPSADISCTELFGPIAILFRVNNYEEALAMANNSPYGLTACIHTKNYHRVMDFTTRVQTGVAVVNAGTYGSEPHMPFGGRRLSGNGTREPGTEALDIYSDLKDVYMVIDPALV